MSQNSEWGGFQTTLVPKAKPSTPKYTGEELILYILLGALVGAALGALLMYSFPIEPVVSAG